MAIFNVSDSAALRDAIQGAGSTDQIILGNDPANYSSIITLAKRGSITPPATGSAGYTISGGGNLVTNARIFSNVDAAPPGTVENIVFNYLTGGPRNGDYILNANSGSFLVQNSTFQGDLTGATASGGVYMFVQGGVPTASSFTAIDLTLDSVSVNLIGQQGFTGAGGGSSFIQSFYNSGLIEILNSSFDETDYRNAFTILETTTAIIDNNTFFRSAPNQTVRSEGERLIDVGAGSEVTRNTFQNGAYLDLDGTIPPVIQGNSFQTIIDTSGTIGPGILFRSGVADGFYPLISDNEFSGDGIALKYQILTPNSVIQTGANSVDGILFGNLYVGGQAADNINGNALDNWISGDGGADSIFGNAGEDSILGGDGEDTIFGQQGNDTILGQDGEDLLIGGAGLDSVSGGEGDDIIFELFGLGNNFLEGDEGEDTIVGGFNNDTIFGGSDADLLIGVGGSDSLYGGTADDTLLGGAAADLLQGDEGSDELTGGAGADRFQYNVESGSLIAGGDTILDFTIFQGDVISTSTLTGIGTFVQGTASAVGETLITAGTAGNNANFVSGAGAVALSAQATFIYDTAANTLSFDSDGTAGGDAGTLIATLTGGPALTAAQISIA